MIPGGQTHVRQVPSGHTAAPVPVPVQVAPGLNPPTTKTPVSAAPVIGGGGGGVGIYRYTPPSKLRVAPLPWAPYTPPSQVTIVSNTPWEPVLTVDGGSTDTGPTSGGGLPPLQLPGQPGVPFSLKNVPPLYLGLGALGLILLLRR